MVLVGKRYIESFNLKLLPSETIGTDSHTATSEKEKKKIGTRTAH